VSALAAALLAELSDRDLDRLAELLAPRLAGRLQAAPSSEWLNAEQAAAYLACSRGRVYDLVQLGKLTPRRDGRRVLFRRFDLDAYLERSA
jgi:excisionase family DNA binding protein